MSSGKRKSTGLATGFEHLAETPNRFAHSNGERGDDFQAFYARFGKLPATLATGFGEQEFGVAENSGKRVVEFMTQEFTEVFRVGEFGGGRREADPVRSNKSAGKAGRLLRTRWNRRIARRPGARSDHAPGARRGSGHEALGCFRETCEYVVRITVGRCNWQKMSSTSDAWLFLNG